MPLCPATRFFQLSSVPMPSAQTNPTPVTTTRRVKSLAPSCGDLPAAYLALLCFSMYSMASFTVVIFSASSSGTSMPNASSNAITNSTWSSESAPRSSTNDAVGVTSASSTPSCSTIICFTRSSTLAIRIPPPRPCRDFYSAFTPGAGRTRAKIVVFHRFGQPAHSMHGLSQGQLTLPCKLQERSLRCCACPSLASSGKPGPDFCPLRDSENPRGTDAVGRHRALSQVHAAVDVQHVAGDVSGFVAGQKQDGGANVAGQTHAAQWNPRLEFFLDLVRQYVGHRRFDEARRDGVYGDAAGGDLDGDGLGQANQAGLCSDVIRLARVAALRHHRGNIDDPPGPRLHHHRQSLLYAQVRAGKVGLQHGVPVVFFHAHGEAVARDGGVVHQDVQPTEFLHDVLESGSYLLRIGDVHPDSQRFPAGPGDI